MSVLQAKPDVTMSIDSKTMVNTYHVEPTCHGEYSIKARLDVLGNQPVVGPGRFAELVAVNRCAVGKVFEDRYEATAWLEHTSG